MQQFQEHNPKMTMEDQLGSSSTKPCPTMFGFSVWIPHSIEAFLAELAAEQFHIASNDHQIQGSNILLHDQIAKI
jgi:hypothetical protein